MAKAVGGRRVNVSITVGFEPWRCQWGEPIGGEPPGGHADAKQRTRTRSQVRCGCSTFACRSAAHFIVIFRKGYGPLHKAFAALPADKAEALENGPTNSSLRSTNRAKA